jgi:hypothetical protein
MNTAVGVHTPAAVLARVGRGQTQRAPFSRFVDALKKSRRREARLVIARYAHLLPPDHPWRRGSYRWKP